MLIQQVPLPLKPANMKMFLCFYVFMFLCFYVNTLFMAF